MNKLSIVVFFSLSLSLYSQQQTYFPGSGPAVTNVVSDTNVTGSISGSTLTLGWTGALAKARQNAATAYTDQANTFGAFTQSFGGPLAVVADGSATVPTLILGSGSFATNWIGISGNRFMLGSDSANDYILGSQKNVIISTAGVTGGTLVSGTPSLDIVGSNGDVLINTTTDDGANKLQVNGSGKFTTSATTSVIIDTTAAVSTSVGLMLSNAGTNLWQIGSPMGAGSKRFFINDITNSRDILSAPMGGAMSLMPTSGDVLIGTATDDGTHKLQVAGFVSFSGIDTSSGINVGGVLNVTGKIATYNSMTTVANGVASIVAKADAVAQSANVATTTLFAVPAGGAGMYRASCYVVITQAATTSSTMPYCGVLWTDSDTNTSSGVQVTSQLNTNTVGTTSANGSLGQSTGTAIINAKASSNITYQTVNYASSGATPMQYAIHVKLEYLGN